MKVVLLEKLARQYQTETGSRNYLVISKLCLCDLEGDEQTKKIFRLWVFLGFSF